MGYRREVRRSPAFLVVAAAACGSFGASPSPSPSPSPSDDAGVDTPDASTVADASGIDATQPTGESPCVTPPAGALLCEDFESDKPFFGFTDAFGAGPPAAFSGTRIPAGGRGTVLSYRATISPPARNGWLRFGPAGTAGDATFTQLVLTMDVAVVSQGFYEGILGAFWMLPGAGGVPDVHGIGTSANGTILDATSPRTTTLEKMIAPGAWHAVRVSLARAGSSLVRTVTVDGSAVESTVVSVEATGWDVRIGMYYSSDGDAEVLFDNVVVTRQ
jgi:hypothetical protein